MNKGFASLFAGIVTSGLVLSPYPVLAEEQSSGIEIIKWEFAGREMSAHIHEVSTERLRFGEPTLAMAHYAWSAFANGPPASPFSVRYYCKLDAKGDYPLRPCSTKKPRAQNQTNAMVFGDRMFKHSFDRLPERPKLAAPTQYQTNYVTFPVDFDPQDAPTVYFEVGRMVDAEEALKSLSGLVRRFASAATRFGFEGDVRGVCKVLEDRSVACSMEQLSERPKKGLTSALNEGALYVKARKKLNDGTSTIGSRFEVRLRFEFKRAS